MNPKKILFKIGSKEICGKLNDTNTANTIYSNLPLKGKVNLWGKEIYFYVPVQVPLEDGKDVVNIGDIAYWPDGPAICIFFGPTPVSTKNEIKPYSKVSLIGKIDDTFLKVLYNIESGEEIVMEPVTSGGD
ncbi:MAG: cyclophilin-like fold protein [Candidatus Omnitrophica bacterium]|nr:cyclophilin-like fold protein [Candidatus Omnitrophota bacterium]